jgi:hypothetical protein
MGNRCEIAKHSRFGAVQWPPKALKISEERRSSFVVPFIQQSELKLGDGVTVCGTY